MSGDFQRFADWLRGRGPTRTAHELQVTPRAVWAWIYNESRPTPDKARDLVKLSAGYLTMDDIYAEAYPSEVSPC
jgi:hypothetical protein